MNFLKKYRKPILRVAAVLGSILLTACIAVLGLNAYVKGSVDERIITSEEASLLSDVDCILVLGCLVRSDGSPSDMLSDRLERGVELYDLGVSDKMLMSGDHGREEYDEVGAMRETAINAGVSAEDVFMDHAGFSTYESMYRAREIFGAKKIVIVSQGYHLYRALYIAEQMGLEAYGVASDQRTYRGQIMRDVREILARVKDMGKCVFMPEPTYLGEKISLDGDGSITLG